MCFGRQSVGEEAWEAAIPGFGHKRQYLFTLKDLLIARFCFVGFDKNPKIYSQLYLL